MFRRLLCRLQGELCILKTQLLYENFTEWKVVRFKAINWGSTLNLAADK